MSNLFDHRPLPNLGITTGAIPIHILQDLNQEIDGIIDDEGNDSNRIYLAGQIAKEYQITKSCGLLNPFLEEMGRAYQKEWDYYPNGDDPKVDLVWVNMQKKLEVNPLHNHDGTLSFVAWLRVPFKVEDELKCSPTGQLISTFQFVYTSILGNLTNQPLMVETGWEGRIVMFPSKLMHIVYPFQTSDEYRISIAGNLR